jgi:thiol-disulfide isomerase/thioredoxin
MNKLTVVTIIIVVIIIVVALALCFVNKKKYFVFVEKFGKDNGTTSTSIENPTMTDIVNTNTTAATNASPKYIDSMQKKNYKLYYFFSNKCPVCLALHKTDLVDKLRWSLGNMFIEVNTDLPENNDLQFYYSVSAIPTFILVGANNNKKIIYTGSRNFNSVTSFLNDNTNN